MVFKVDDTKPLKPRVIHVRNQVRTFVPDSTRKNSYTRTGVGRVTKVAGRWEAQYPDDSKVDHDFTLRKTAEHWLNMAADVRHRNKVLLEKEEG